MDASLYPQLKAHILGSVDPAVVAARTIRNDSELARLYNLASAVVVWRKSLSKDALRKAAIAGSSEMDNLEAGKRDALFWMLSDAVDPSDSAVRAAFSDLTANRTGGFVATALRASLTAAAKRFATVAESVYQPTGTNANPGQLVFDGTVTIDDIGAAFAG